jgi:DNA-binding XRE family transcriptional regulator
MTELHDWDVFIKEKYGEDYEFHEGVQRHKRRLENVIKLYEMRTKRGKTQTALAAELGVSQRRVSQIEHTANPTIETLEAYVKALGGRLEIRAVFPDTTVTFTTS